MIDWEVISMQDDFIGCTYADVRTACVRKSGDDVAY